VTIADDVTDASNCTAKDLSTLPFSTGVRTLCVAGSRRENVGMATFALLRVGIVQLYYSLALPTANDHRLILALRANAAFRLKSQ
jgi:hypothetical protein